MSIFVLVLASLALLAVATLVWWRRRQPVPVSSRRSRRRAREHTLFATPFEQLGVAPLPPEQSGDDATACIAYDALAVEQEPEDGTAILDMQALHQQPEPPRPTIPSDLLFHFDLAVNAYAQWRQAMAGPRKLEAIAEGPERSWRDAIELLVGQFTAASCNPLLDTVRTPASAQARVVAALALLEHREFEAVALLTELLPDGAETACEEVIDALALWRGPTADGSLLRALSLQFPRRALAWSKLLLRRGLDPGSELVTRYLEAPEPELVCAGFELLAVHAERRYCWSAIVGRIYDTNPAIQAAAITAGLRNDVDVAWAQCRELAMSPEYPQLCALMASLSTLSEQRRLITWATRDDVPPHALWCAALTGRAEAIELALARLDTAPELARRCLDHLTGNPDANLDWWALNKERFWVDRRWLTGLDYDCHAVRRGIAELGPPHRSALTLELGIRCAQLAGLRVDGYAHELLRELDQIEIAGLDFERGFPWSTP